MAFKALIVDKAEDGTVSQSIETIAEDRLPEAGVTVAVEYSTLNYKDGLCLTGRVRLPATVIPFLLRGVNLLGIDSVMQPQANRTIAWRRIANDLPMEKLGSMISPATLADLSALGKAILEGQVKGCVVVDVNA